MPMYATFGGALLEIWLVCIGGPEFAVGDNQAPAFFENNQGDTLTHVMLLTMFVLSCFILLIHLLNMLIAIMSDAFTQDNDDYDKKRLLNLLQFINVRW